MFRFWQLPLSLILIIIVRPYQTAWSLTSRQGLAILGALTVEAPTLKPKACTARELFNTVKPYIGRTPYTWGGTNPNKGMDCSAFVRHILAKFKVYLPRTAREQARAGKPVKTSRIIAGDLIFFDTSRTRPGIDHVGLYLGKGYFVHACASQGVTIDRLMTYPYPIVRARRVL